MGLILPYQYNEGEYQADSFEDITQKNLRFIARAFGVTQRLRIMHGVVSSAGAFVAGTAGWTSSRTGTGTFKVEFEKAFDAAPTGLVSGVTGVANALAVPGSVDVSTFDVGGGAADHSFSFLVVL